MVVADLSSISCEQKLEIAAAESEKQTEQTCRVTIRSI